MSAAVFADHSSEVLSPSQAELFIAQLEAEERESHFQVLRRKIQEAERSGNLEEAMRLYDQAGEVKRQIRHGSG